MEIDWDQAEETVHNSAVQCLREFAGKHKDEVFYGFFLDCNATYFEILGHLNTEELLRQQAHDSKKKHPKLYKDVALKTLIEDLRWSGGDWSYLQMFEACGHSEAYDQLVEALIKHFTLTRRGVDSGVYERFLEMACRVAVRLERGNAFDELQCSQDFRVLCADHDESVEDGERRLRGIRREWPR